MSKQTDLALDMVQYWAFMNSKVSFAFIHRNIVTTFLVHIAGSLLICSFICMIQKRLHPHACLTHQLPRYCTMQSVLQNFHYF